MRKVVIVTGPEQFCGIYQHAADLYNCVLGSNKYEFLLVTASSAHEFSQKMRQINPDAIIYNWHQITLSWLNDQITSSISIPQMMITGHSQIHETIQFANIRDYMIVNPVFPHVSDNIHAEYRPVVYFGMEYAPPSGTIKIGTSGFGGTNKNLKKIINIIKKQFTEQPVILNVHFSVGAYTSASTMESVNQIVRSCESDCSENIKINPTIKLMEHEELVRWLNQNDLNIYYYDNAQCYGVSGSIDKALSAKKPIAVNDVSFFKHIIKEEIDINKTPLIKIIENGIQPLEEYYLKWNPKTITHQFESILDRYYE